MNWGTFRSLFFWILLTELLRSEANVRTHHHHVSHSGIRSVDLIKASSFADSLFAKYGNNGSMDIDNFKRLLKELKIGGNDDKDITNTGEVENKCLSASSLLDVYSLNKTKLDGKDFEKICPAIIQQIEGKTCSYNTAKKKVKTAQSKTKAWGFGFLSVTIISCASLVGAFVVPFMTRAFYQTLLLFMVSLAVGVLCGSGVFHLIPGTFGFGYDGDISYLYKCAVIVAGIYLFFFLEYMMKMYIRFKDPDHDGHSHGHHHSHALPLEKPKANGKEEIPGTEIAEVQLEMYNYRQDRHRAHSNSFCISNDLNKKLDSSVIGKICSNGEELSNPSESDDLFVDVNQPNNVTPTKTGKQPIAPVAWMIVIGDSVHNFIDGLAIGAGFSSSTLEGVSTAIAIFCEELPHELGDFAVLLNGGMSYKQALFYNFLSACSCFLGLVIGLLLGYNTPAVKWIYALAGGMFLYISLVDMLQEATEMSVKEGEGSVKDNLKTFALQNFGMLLGLIIMFVLAIYGPTISL